jgi:hypothetical protein
MFELETILAFGLGAGLMALAPMVRKAGNDKLGDSMAQAGRSMAKGGVKLGVTVAGAAGGAANYVARQAAEAAESFVDLVAEAKSELADEPQEAAVVAKQTSSKKSRKVTVTDVTVE